MSVSTGWHCRTSVTMLSCPGKTWESCCLRAVVSSGVLSCCWNPVISPCWCPGRFPCARPLPRPPSPDASRAPPSVLSRKFKTSVWERGCLAEGRAVARPAKVWFPGSGVLTGSKKDIRLIQKVRMKDIPYFAGFLTCAQSEGSRLGEVLLFPEGHQGPWRDHPQMCTVEVWRRSRQSVKLLFLELQNLIKVFTDQVKLVHHYLQHVTSFWWCPSMQGKHLRGLSGCRLSR